MFKINTKLGLIYFCSLLVLIGMTGSFAIDMYVPSMPAIAHSFSVSEMAVKFSLTSYLLAYAFGQLCYGPLLDCFGRKYIMLIAIVIGFLGSLVCAEAHSILWLNIGRIIQGSGFAAIGVAAPAIGRDVLSDTQFAQTSSVLSMIFGLGPLLSPVIGSYIGHLFGWRMTFEVISIYATFVFTTIIILVPETHMKGRRQEFHISKILITYKKIMTNNIFLGNTLGKACAYTGFMVFYTVTPFMLQEHLHLTAIQYGWVTLSLTCTILFIKGVNTVLLRYMPVEKIIYYATILLFISGLFALLFAVFGAYSLRSILIPFILFAIAAGFLFPNTTVAAFRPFKGVSSGSVSGLISFIQLFSAFVGSAVAAHLSTQSLLPLGIFMFFIGIVVFVQYVVLVSPTKMTAQDRFALSSHD